MILFNASTRLQGIKPERGFFLADRLGAAPFGDAGGALCLQGRDEPLCAGNDTRPNRQAAAVRQPVFNSPTRHTGCGCALVPKPAPILALEKAIADLSLAELVNYRREGMPLGELVLPSLRWILRRHTLEGDDDTRFLLRQYISSAWHIANDFGSAAG